MSSIEWTSRQNYSVTLEIAYPGQGWGILVVKHAERLKCIPGSWREIGLPFVDLPAWYISSALQFENKHQTNSFILLCQNKLYTLGVILTPFHPFYASVVPLISGELPPHKTKVILQRSRAASLKEIITKSQDFAVLLGGVFLIVGWLCKIKDLCTLVIHIERNWKDVVAVPTWFC